MTEAVSGSGSGSRTPTAAIVSAAGGMTDALVSVVNTSVLDTAEAGAKLQATAERQIKILLDLVPNKPELTDPVIANINKDREGTMAILQAVMLMRGVPPQVLELVAGLGEVWSAQTLATYMRASGVVADWVDAR